MATLAVMTGLRRYRLVTSVPRRIRVVLNAIAASVVLASNIVARGWSGSVMASRFHRTSNPASSARRHRSTKRETG
jgi:hypothetical protein